jgi:hypothetical protein
MKLQRRRVSTLPAPEKSLEAAARSSGNFGEPTFPSDASVSTWYHQVCEEIFQTLGKTFGTCARAILHYMRSWTFTYCCSGTAASSDLFLQSSRGQSYMFRRRPGAIFRRSSRPSLGLASVHHPSALAGLRAAMVLTFVDFQDRSVSAAIPIEIWPLPVAEPSKSRRVPVVARGRELWHPRDQVVSDF